MEKKEIVKLGYEKLRFNTLYLEYIKYYSNYAVCELEKERVRRRIKYDFECYYLRDSLLHEPMNQKNIIYVDTLNSSYKIVTLPKKVLKMILVKNKLGGYIKVDKIVTEQDFDKLFDEFYPQMIEIISEVSGAKWDCI